MQRTFSIITVVFVLGCNGPPATTRPAAAPLAPSATTETKPPEPASATPSSPPTPPPPRGVAGKYTIDNDASVRALGPGPGPDYPQGQVNFGQLRATMRLIRSDMDLRADGGYTMTFSVDAEGEFRDVSKHRGVWRLTGPVLTLTRSDGVDLTCRVASSTLECRARADQPAGIFRRVD